MYVYIHIYNNDNNDVVSSKLVRIIYIYIYINFKPKTTCVVVNISKYKNT